MKLVSKIFKRTDWYVTSKFGMRLHPIDKVYKMHNGTDYGTHSKKLPLYAIEEGYVQKVVTGQNKAKTGYGNYVWVRYPRLNISLLHAHMDSVKVKKGDQVKEGTLLGYTGTTGASTGIHLHLGMTLIGSDKWLDPHAYNYEEPVIEEKKQDAPVKEEKKEDAKPKETASNELKVGDKVKIIGFGNATSYGTGRLARGIGWTRTIKKIYPGRKYPYQVGNALGTTGFYNAKGLKKL